MLRGACPAIGYKKIRLILRPINLADPDVAVLVRHLVEASDLRPRPAIEDPHVSAGWFQSFVSANVGVSTILGHSGSEFKKVRP